MKDGHLWGGSHIEISLASLSRPESRVPLKSKQSPRNQQIKRKETHKQFQPAKGILGALSHPPLNSFCWGFSCNFHKFRRGVGGPRGLAQGNPSHTTNSGFFLLPPFSYAPLRMGEHNSGGHLLLYFGCCWSPTPSPPTPSLKKGGTLAFLS